MPLEDLTGNRFISDLNENWPLGTDLPDAGDDHLRGIKNVLKRSFPGVTGPVTLTQDELNRGSVPAGSVMLFYQAAAPVGWTRVAGIASTHMLRVVASTTAGGTSGGSDDPVLNNKVPTHTHGVNAVASGGQSVNHVHNINLNTGSESADHSHTGWTSANGWHQHGLPGPVPYGNAGAPYSLEAGNDFRHNYITATDGAGEHQHSVQTGGRSAAHYHNVSGSSSAESATHTHTVPAHNTNANAGAANWVPRYLDVIVCQRN